MSRLNRESHDEKEREELACGAVTLMLVILEDGLMEGRVLLLGSQRKDAQEERTSPLLKEEPLDKTKKKKE